LTYNLHKIEGFLQPILNSNKLLRFFVNGCIKCHINSQFFDHLLGFELVNCDISVISFVFISTEGVH